MGRGRKTKPETLQHAIRRLERIRAQRDAARQALNGLLNVIGCYDDGGWFICEEGAEAAITEANRVSVELAGGEPT